MDAELGHGILLRRRQSTSQSELFLSSWSTRRKDSTPTSPPHWLAERQPTRLHLLRLLPRSLCSCLDHDWWTDLRWAIADRSRLATLNISSNPLHSLPRVANKNSSLLRLTNLVLLSSTLYSHISLANLSERVPKLETLRFSLAPDAQLAIGTEGPKLSGNDEEDSGVLVALFSNLRLLNGYSINLKQREDAERRWCNRFTVHEAPSILKLLYDTLSTKHGLHPTPQVIPRPTSLRSKLISKSASCHTSE